MSLNEELLVRGEFCLELLKSHQDLQLLRCQLVLAQLSDPGVPLKLGQPVEMIKQIPGKSAVLRVFDYRTLHAKYG